jgi:hypothetical protein
MQGLRITSRYPSPPRPAVVARSSRPRRPDTSPDRRVAPCPPRPSFVQAGGRKGKSSLTVGAKPSRGGRRALATSQGIELANRGTPLLEFEVPLLVAGAASQDAELRLGNGALEFLGLGRPALGGLAPSDEGHEAPEGGTRDEDDAQGREDPAPAAEVLLEGAADRRPDQLQHPVHEERYPVGGGQLLDPEHVRHDDRRHADVDARGKAEDAAVDRDHDEARGHRQDRQGDARDEESAHEVPVLRHELRVRKGGTADSPCKVLFIRFC